MKISIFRSVSSLLLYLSLAFLAYTFFGYPLIIGILAGARNRPIRKLPFSKCPTGSVSVLLSLHNEGPRASSRILNLFETEFPSDQIEVIAVSDGSSDETAQLLSDLAELEPRLKLVILNSKSGKPAALNSAVSHATGDYLVFADARQRFDRNTIPHLIANFSDSTIGAVSGELEIARSVSGSGAGTDVYWRLEKFIRHSESKSGSVIGCTGAVYAIRSSLFSPIPEDTILDDVVIPMTVVEKGFRVIFEPDAVAFDPQPLSPSNEQRRKTRTLAGNFQMLFRYLKWLLPSRNSVSWRLISHKYCRLVAPVALLVSFVSSALLAFSSSPHLIAIVLFWSQTGFYLLAILGYFFPKAIGRLGSIPAAFLFLNILVINGLIYFIRNRNQLRSGWR